MPVGGPPAQARQLSTIASWPERDSVTALGDAATCEREEIPRTKLMIYSLEEQRVNEDCLRLPSYAFHPVYISRRCNESRNDSALEISRSGAPPKSTLGVQL